MKFNPDSSFFRAMGTFASFVLVNLVFIVTCIPLVTIGAGLAAMQRTMMRYIDNEATPLTKTYWRNFKASLVLGTQTWLTVLALAAVFIFNISFWRSSPLWFATPVMVVMIIATVVLLMIVEVLFPLVGTFKNSYRQTMKNAALMVLPSFGKVLLLIAIDAGALALFGLTRIGRAMFVIFGFAFWLYIKAFVEKKLFTKYSDKV